MVRSILTNEEGRIVTTYFGEAPSEEPDWKEVPTDQYIRPSPPEDHVSSSYLKEEAGDLEYDEESDLIGVVFEEREEEDLEE